MAFRVIYAASPCIKTFNNLHNFLCYPLREFVNPAELIYSVDNIITNELALNALSTLLDRLREMDNDWSQHDIDLPKEGPAAFEVFWQTINSRLDEGLKEIRRLAFAAGPSVDFALIALERPETFGDIDSAQHKIWQASFASPGTPESSNAYYFQDQEPFPFARWLMDHTLQVKICRFCDNIPEVLSRYSVSTCLDLILKVAHSSDSIDNKVKMILSSNQFKYGDFGSISQEEFLKASARTLLLQTRRAIAWLETDLSQIERNILFIPVYAGGQAIGVAIFQARSEFSQATITVTESAVRLLLFRLRARDEKFASTLILKERARWEATMLYIHRLQHDVRKPLRTVHDRLRKLLDDPSLKNEEQITLMNAILRRIDDLQDLISSGATTSIEGLRLQAAQDARGGKVRDLLDDAFWLWKVDADKLGKILLKPEITPPNLDACIPRNLVVEILENLVSNALRAATSTVQVTATETTENGRRGVEFTVIDDGPGLPQKYIDEIYQPFKLSDRRTSGLGLPLAEFVVNNLLDGSHLRFSQAGHSKGTAVNFFVPEFDRV